MLVVMLVEDRELHNYRDMRGLRMARCKRPLFSVSSCWLHGDVLLHNQRVSYK